MDFNCCRALWKSTINTATTKTLRQILGSTDHLEILVWRCSSLNKVLSGQYNDSPSLTYMTLHHVAGQVSKLGTKIGIEVRKAPP